MRKVFYFYLLLCLALIFRLFFFYTTLPDYKDGQEISFITQVLTNPKEYSSYQTLYVNIDPLNRVLIRLPKEMRVSYGEYLKVTGKLKVRVLSSGSSIFTINKPNIEANIRENSFFWQKIFNTREKIISEFSKELDPVSSALLLGITFGIKGEMPQNFFNQIQTTGVMHVIAASGMNVTMVAGFFFYLFALIFKRRLAVFVSIAGVLFYTALAGFEPSIIRAAIMGIIVFSAQILGRQYYGLLSLVLTTFVMLFIWPSFLVNTGFQLSIAATAGILLIPGLFKRLENDFTQDFIVTLSAQMATLPILLANFGNYSIFSIVTNALVLWTIPPLMVLGSIAAVFSFVFEPISKIFLYLSIPLLYFFEKVVSYFSRFGTTLNLDSLPWQFIFGYYLLLSSILAYRWQKRRA